MPACSGRRRQREGDPSRIGIGPGVYLNFLESIVLQHWAATGVASRSEQRDPGDSRESRQLDDAGCIAHRWETPSSLCLQFWPISSALLVGKESLGRTC